MWGGVPHTIAPGEKIKMEEGMARVFAIHLGEREAERMKIVPVRVTDPFIAMANRALPEGGTVAPDIIARPRSSSKEELLHKLSSGQEREITAQPVGASEFTLDPEVDDVKKEVKAEDYTDAALAKELLAENATKMVRNKGGRPKKQPVEEVFEGMKS